MDFILVEVRRDLPFHQARQVAIDAFEAGYLAALLQRHRDLLVASEWSGLDARDLITLIKRFTSATA